MIRKFQKKDTEMVLDIWLQSSIQAHNFISKSYWESKIHDMREIYLPAADTTIYEDDQGIKGFISLSGNTIAAIFVMPDQQGLGIGQKLISTAKQLHSSLDLTVYKENTKTIEFYKKNGFEIINEQFDEHTGHPELLMKFKQK